ncbi:MAG: response regulator [Caldilineaceae bacterium]
MDDQPLQLRAVTALLAKHYQVYTAQSGIEAIRLLENMAVGGQLNRLQAILLDVTMPELNGLAILELIRFRYPRMPIIICSAHQSVR